MPEANPFLQLHDDLLYRIDERPHVALDRVAPGDPPAESSEGWVLTVDRQRIELPKPPPLPEPPVWEPLTLEPDWTGTTAGGDDVNALAPAYFDFRKSTIYGGTSEVQKTIIAKSVLG